MKSNRNRIVIFLMPVIVVILFGIVSNLGSFLINVDSASTGLARSHLQTIGRAIAFYLNEHHSYPRDFSSDRRRLQSGETNDWYFLLDVAKVLGDSGTGNNEDIPKKYFDARIWSVVKNIPDDPPPNLIVLATRNVDVSSLRTKITNMDMLKRVRYKEQKDDLKILNKVAVLVRADGMAISIPVVSPTSRRTYKGEYNQIYCNIPFDLTTNTVNGLQVKYLTPEGEVVPTND